MVKRFQLQDYDVIFDPELKQCSIWITGHKAYYNIICDAFPNKGSNIIKDSRRTYDWEFHVQCENEEMKETLENLLKLFTYAVYIDDKLHQSFALDFYYKPYWNDPEGGHTLAGNLVNKSKYYPNGTHEHTKQVNKLTNYIKRFISLHPSYRHSDYIVGIPFFGEKSFDLPTHITKQVAQDMGITSIQNFVKKVRSTQSMKSLETEDEKRENIKGAFKISDKIDLQNKSIIVIDDVYRSGITMSEFCKELSIKGATILGLVATKTIRD